MAEIPVTLRLIILLLIQIYCNAESNLQFQTSNPGAHFYYNSQPSSSQFQRQHFSSRDSRTNNVEFVPSQSYGPLNFLQQKSIELFQHEFGGGNLVQKSPGSRYQFSKQATFEVSPVAKENFQFPMEPSVTQLHKLQSQKQTSSTFPPVYSLQETPTETPNRFHENQSRKIIPLRIDKTQIGEEEENIQSQGFGQAKAQTTEEPPYPLKKSDKLQGQQMKTRKVITLKAMPISVPNLYNQKTEVGDNGNEGHSHSSPVTKESPLPFQKFHRLSAQQKQKLETVAGLPQPKLIVPPTPKRSSTTTTTESPLKRFHRLHGEKIEAGRQLLLAPKPQPEEPVNQQVDSDDKPDPFAFSYNVNADHFGTRTKFSRREESDGHTLRGEYRVLLPDGRLQIVSYLADLLHGFRSKVTYIPATVAEISMSTSPPVPLVQEFSSSEDEMEQEIQPGRFTPKPACKGTLCTGMDLKEDILTKPDSHTPKNVDGMMQQRMSSTLGMAVTEKYDNSKNDNAPVEFGRRLRPSSPKKPTIEKSTLPPLTQASTSNKKQGTKYFEYKCPVYNAAKGQSKCKLVSKRVT